MWCLAAAAIFPQNGLDRSLHVSVVIGLAFVTFFTEAYGWTYAGLVVPGYLATVFVAAPVTGALMVFEAVLTHALVAALGRFIPELSGAWSAAFGRERFFLYIVVAVLVRLGVEGSVVPWITAHSTLAHSRELYSIGLVLVPLIANVFWNSGLRHAGPRLLVLTLLTYAVLQLVLLPGTNYSISRFQVANESVAMRFLDAPKAYIILLTGALLAARNNVLHGWDYNGILVPALLAVAWYEPTKCIATFAEALLVYAVSRALTSLPPLSRMLLVGPRKMLFVVVVGFALKIAVGFALAHHAPGVQLVDYLGFGYILPSLLAIKIWNKDRIGVVLMPTIQVSILAFFVGNGIGYGLRHLDGSSAAPLGEVERVGDVHSAAFELTLADTSPYPAGAADASAAEEYRLAAAVLLDASAELRAGGELGEMTRRRAAGAKLGLRRDSQGWIAAAHRAADPEDVRPAPRVALHARLGRVEPSMVVVVAPEPSASLTTAAYAAAEHLAAGALVLVSRHDAWRRHDEQFVQDLAERLGIRRLIAVELGREPGASLHVIGSMPEGLDVRGLGRVLDVDIDVAWRSEPRERGDSLLAQAPRLVLAAEVADAAGAALLGAPEVQVWPGSMHTATQERLEELTSTGPSGYLAPTVEELRVFAQLVAPGVMAGAAGAGAPAWTRAVAAQLGYRFVEAGSAAGPHVFGIAEPPSESRRGGATWMLRAAGGTEPLLLEVPAPRWEVGTFAGALALFEALPARGILLSGAMPHGDPFGRADARRPEGRRSYYQQIHETWLSAEHRALSVQGIVAERAPAEDVVLSLGREIARRDVEPGWLSAVRAPFEVVDLRVATFDGTREHAPFSGSNDPTMAFAERFAEDRFAIVWLAPGLRSYLSRMGAAHRRDTWIPAGRLAGEDVDVGARALELASCTTDCPTSVRRAAGCDLERAVDAAELLNEQHNPFDWAAVAGSSTCHVELVRGTPSRLPWAILAAPGRARLVPLHGVAVPSSTRRLRDLPDIRRAVAMATAIIRVEAPQ